MSLRGNFFGHLIKFPQFGRNDLRDVFYIAELESVVVINPGPFLEDRSFIFAGYLGIVTPERIFAPKWCQKIVRILCYIVLQFLNFVLHSFRRYPQGRFESQPPITNFRSEMVSTSCAAQNLINFSTIWHKITIV